MDQDVRGAVPRAGHAPAAAGTAAPVQGYLANACSTTGAGLVVVAALVSALRPRPTPAAPPEIDHWS